MTAGGKKGARPGRAFFSRGRIMAVAGGVAAAALFSFSLGFISSRVYNRAAETVNEDAGAEKSEPYAGFTPKRLDADAIMSEPETGGGQPAQGEFSFPETLKQETAPSADPFRRETSPSAPAEKRDGRAEKPKAPPEKKTAAVNKERKALRERKEGRLTIQVGSFVSASDAERLKRRLEAKGYDAYTQTARIGGKTWVRVRVGAFKSASAAKRAAEKLQKDEKLPTLVMTYERSR